MCMHYTHTGVGRFKVNCLRDWQLFEVNRVLNSLVLM